MAAVAREQLRANSGKGELVINAKLHRWCTIGRKKVQYPRLAIDHGELFYFIFELKLFVAMLSVRVFPE